ncbi:PTS transporter subunit EIIC [Ferrimonas lipolytica]|uniref:PTS transporter subunit EIIC n=1 Tax=Ferrimonas lipolytica TaxID=2724191 RepID=A0A6H1UFM2_9GAMM|nr:PTS transporter subunit EIIC [Ferrimonas lipolytica]QIZ77400.1 PTS transporter subunit EIIC [Ferrimonas lipolytica]
MKTLLFHRVQRMGKALMVPVAVLPIAGLLIGLGSSPIPHMPPLLGILLLNCGKAVFEFLPIMFAIAVALTFSDQDGTAALAAVIGYGTKLAAMAAMATHYGWQTQSILGFDSLDTGVLGGVIIGIMTSWVYRHFHQIELPALFAFFSGRRFVPLVNVVAGMMVGIVMALLWPLLQAMLDQFSDWAVYQSPMLAWWVYGTVERLLVPLGFHHIWNLPFFYEIGTYVTLDGQEINGEVSRFIAGDPNAGYLAGGYLIKMFGLPAAALAIWRCSDPKLRSQTGSIMLSAALTSWLTGVTEPIEFAFLFVSPVLFLVHAVLTGSAYVVAIFFEIHHGTVFSQGLLDFILYYQLAYNLQPLLLLGPLYAVIYFVVFRAVIVRFNLPTPGRGSRHSNLKQDIEVDAILAALGGPTNVKNVDACLTRLRLALYEPAQLDREALLELGAKGVLNHGEGVQIVLGSQAASISEQLRQLVR